MTKRIKLVYILSSLLSAMVKRCRWREKMKAASLALGEPHPHLNLLMAPLILQQLYPPVVSLCHLQTLFAASHINTNAYGHTPSRLFARSLPSQQFTLPAQAQEIAPKPRKLHSILSTCTSVLFSLPLQQSKWHKKG